MKIDTMGMNGALEGQWLAKKAADSEKDFGTTLEKAMETQDEKALKEACEEVETYMLTTIFKQMKKSTEMGERLIPKGDYEEMFEDQMIELQCKEMVKAGGIGLADMMYKQMMPEKKVDNSIEVSI